MKSKAPFLTALLVVLTLGSHWAIALDGPTPVRDLGPSGLEIDLQKNNTLKVTGVLPGSPADGKFTAGQIIQKINGTPIPEGFWQLRQHLADLITKAEATDGNPGYGVVNATGSNMLNGHTGPIGTIWYSPMAALVTEKKPSLYRNRQDEVRWFYELSRLHDGSVVMSSCRGYDNIHYCSSMSLGLTA